MSPSKDEKAAAANVVTGLQLLEKARPLEAMQLFGDALKTLERSSMLDLVAVALVGKGDVYLHLGQPEYAIPTLEEVIDRFRHREEPLAREYVLRALIKLGVAFVQRGQPERALDAFERAATWFGSASDPKLLRLAQVARENGANVCEDAIVKLLAEAAAAESRNDLPSAISAYDQITSRFTDDRLNRLQCGSGVRSRLAYAERCKGTLLMEAGKADGALRCFANVIQRYASETPIEFRAQVAVALTNRAYLLGELGWGRQAEGVYEELITAAAGAPEAEIRRIVSQALGNRAGRLIKNGESQAAIAVLDDIVARYACALEPDLRACAAMALSNKGAVMMPDREAAIDVFNQVIARFGDDADSAVREHVANARHNVGLLRSRGTQ